MALKQFRRAVKVRVLFKSVVRQVRRCARKRDQFGCSGLVGD